MPTRTMNCRPLPATRGFIVQIDARAITLGPRQIFKPGPSMAVPHESSAFKTEDIERLLSIKGVEKVCLDPERLEIHMSSGSLARAARRVHEVLNNIYGGDLELDTTTLAA